GAGEVRLVPAAKGGLGPAFFPRSAAFFAPRLSAGTVQESMHTALAALLCAAVATGASAKVHIVRWSHAEASKAIYKGKCPVRLVFTGTILAGRKGDVTFAWKRSDGFVGPMRTIHATRRGQGWRVNDEWELYTTTRDRKSTRLNSSHLVISYAVFC